MILFPILCKHLYYEKSKFRLITRFAPTSCADDKIIIKKEPDFIGLDCWSDYMNKICFPISLADISKQFCHYQNSLELMIHLELWQIETKWSRFSTEQLIRMPQLNESSSWIYELFQSFISTIERRRNCLESHVALWNYAKFAYLHSILRKDLEKCASDLGDGILKYKSCESRIKVSQHSIVLLVFSLCTRWCPTFNELFGLVIPKCRFLEYFSLMLKC